MSYYDTCTQAKIPANISMDGKAPLENIESSENLNQYQPMCSYKLPKEMKPSKSVFESLGFTFKNFGNSILYKATLPIGWTLSISKNGSLTHFIDNQGRERGNSFYTGLCHTPCGHMNLFTRYHISYDKINSKEHTDMFSVTVKDFDGSVIFNAGQCLKMYSEKAEELSEIAKAYMDATYPEWNDPTKYWD